MRFKIQVEEMALHTKNKSSLHTTWLLLLFINLLHPFIGFSGTLVSQNTTSSNNVSFNQNNTEKTAPFFPLVYTGFGIDHMNINLVNLSATGLMIGDEIGVFDGNNCVGSAIIKTSDINENRLSIPASANDNVEKTPNGYIDGHPITLKSYRSGTIYILYYKTVNNSNDVFERKGSMFALVDFSRSRPQNTEENKSITIYPNPFVNEVKIEFFQSTAQTGIWGIFDMTGCLVKTMTSEQTEGLKTLSWDGKDDNGQLVKNGIYFFRANNKSVKIIFGR